MIVDVDQVVDVYKQAAFDWPLGPLGRIRQKYGKPKVPKSKSEDQLAEVNHHNQNILELNIIRLCTTRLELNLARG